MIFKTTDQLLLARWEFDSINEIADKIKFEKTPPSEEWVKNDKPTIHDVLLWEQIYYKGGHIGIYAAWNPKIELYLITHNLFLDKPEGIQTFFGDDAKKQVWNAAKKLNVTLPINRIWVDDQNEKGYEF